MRRHDEFLNCTAWANGCRLRRMNAPPAAAAAADAGGDAVIWSVAVAQPAASRFCIRVGTDEWRRAGRVIAADRAR